MNWGYKIMTVYLVFVAGIAVMVYQSSSQKIDLVTPDYYAKELKYQERIDAEKRTATLPGKPAWQLKDDTLSLSLPPVFEGKEAAGNATLYCPADETKDISKNFLTNNGQFAIPLPAAVKGAYRLQVSWMADGYDYYFEENILL